VVGQEYDVHALGGIPDHIDERKIMEVLKRDIVG
jgi:hypothetical protein